MQHAVNDLNDPEHLAGASSHLNMHAKIKPESF